MSSGCGDVLSLEDLKIAKSHQLFEAEVITGLQGGVAGGASIDYAVNQVTGQTQKTLPAVLRDAGFRPASFTFTTGGTIPADGADLAVLWPIASGGDGNYYYWKGALPKVIPASSTPAGTGGVSDSAWKPIGDVTLRTNLITAGYGYLVDDSNIKVMQPSSGGALRTQNDKNLEAMSVKDFGAIGNGIVDDTIAIQAAFNWVGGNGVGRTLIIPAGRYVLNNRISVNIANANMLIKGEGLGVSEFSWPSTAAGHGLSFGDATPFSRLFISDLTLSTNIVNPQPAVYARANGGASNAFQMRNMLVYGAGLLGTAANGYFGGGMLALVDTGSPLLENLTFYGVDGGRDNMLLVSAGIYIESRDYMALVPHLVNVSCSFVGYGMFFNSIHVAGIEGIVIDRCNAMCVFGIKVTAENATNPAYYPPQLNISRTQVEFFDYGFDLKHIGAVTVDSCTLLHQPTSSGAGQTAINLVDVARGSITNNYIEQRPATTLNGINVSGSSYGITCTNNTFDIRTGSTCIVFSGASYNCSQYLNKCVNTGALYANISTQAATNTQLSYNASGQLSSSLTDGTIMKAGSAVIVTSAGGAFGVTFTAPFPNNNLTVVACSGDSASTTNPVVITNKTVNGFTGIFVGSGSGSTVRVNFYAMGS